MASYPENYLKPQVYNELITEGQSVQEIYHYFPNIMKCGDPHDYDIETQKRMYNITRECWDRIHNDNEGEGYYSIAIGGIPSLDCVDSIDKIIKHCALLRHIDFWQRHGFLQYSANCYITEHIDDGDGLPVKFPEIDKSKYPYIVPVDTKTASHSEIMQACAERKRRELAFDFPSQSSKKWLLHIDIKIYNLKQTFWEKYINQPQYAGEIVTIVWTAAAHIHKHNYLQSYEYFLKTLQYNCPIRKEILHYVGHDENNKVYLNLPKTKEWKEEVYKKEIEDAKHGILRTGNSQPILTKKQEEQRIAEMRKEDEGFDFICEMAEIESGKRTELSDKFKKHEQVKEEPVKKVTIDKNSSFEDIQNAISTVLSHNTTENTNTDNIEGEEEKTKAEKAVETIAEKNSSFNNPNKIDPQFMADVNAVSDFARKMSPYHIQDVKEYCKDTIDNMLHICDIVLGAEVDDNIPSDQADEMRHVEDDIAEDGWHIDINKSDKAQQALKYIDRPFNSSLYLMAHGNTQYTQDDVDQENAEIKAMLQAEKDKYKEYENGHISFDSFDELIDIHSVYALTEEQLNEYREKQKQTANNCCIPINIRYNNDYSIIYHTILESTKEFVSGNDKTNNGYLYIKTECPLPGYSPVINNLIEDNPNIITISNNITAYFDKLNSIVYLKVPVSIANKYLKEQPFYEYYNSVQITKTEYCKFISKSITNKYIYKTDITTDSNIYVYTPRKDSRAELHGGSDSDGYG